NEKSEEIISSEKEVINSGDEEDEVMLIRGKGIFDDCNNIGEIVDVLNDLMEYFVDLYEEGYDLYEPVSNDHVYITYYGETDDENENINDNKETVKKSEDKSEPVDISKDKLKKKK